LADIKENLRIKSHTLPNLQEEMPGLPQQNVLFGSANQNCCGEYFACYGDNYVVAGTIHTVTTEIITTTILVCGGYISQTFCWSKVIFSVSCIILDDCGLSRGIAKKSENTTFKP